MHVGDWVLREIESAIGAHPPERGGALLGPRGGEWVTAFLPDPEAATTSTSYAPSRSLAARVKDVEREGDLELKGIVHSHPRELDQLSAQDAQELATGLHLNPHMPCYLAPIVTARPAEALEEHELALPSGRVSFFAGYRARSGGVEVRPVPVHCVPLERDAGAVARALGGGEPEIFMARLGAGPAAAARLRLAGVELLVVASELYPTLPPAILATPDGGATEALEAPWALATPEPDRLRTAVLASFAPPGPYLAAFGPRAGPALTRDPGRARLAGWPRRFTGEDPEAAAERLREALFARSAGILCRALRERSALVVGCGSVGSYLAELLARSGVGRLELVDPEAVEPANLSRTAYAAEDVGQLKTAALARRLLAVAPAVGLGLHPRAVDALSPAELDGLVRGAHLVVAATDDPSAQRALNRFAYARERPALFVGIYAGARGGEVLLTVPGRTPCYLCATRARHQAEAATARVARQVDYGTARLAGEMALAADIQHVASAAVKLALSLLLPAETGGALRELAEDAIRDGTPYLTLSTVARYWFYPQVFGDAPGQGAFQSVWLTPVRSERCPVCGPPEQRVDPLSIPLRAPGLAAFDAVLGDGG